MFTLERCLPRLVSRGKVLAWDAREDRENIPYKDAGNFRMSSFMHNMPKSESMTEFIGMVQRAKADPAKFFMHDLTDEAPDWSKSGLEFSSYCASKKDVVHVEKYGPATGRHAVVLIPHWNATQQAYSKIAQMLSWMGLRTFVITLPFHGSRGDGGPVANAFLNADLGATIDAVRQAVIDVRRLIEILWHHGFSSISLLGISLGSCIAALVATFEPRVDRVALILSAGDFAETVWSGTATRHIRERFEGEISLEELKRAWSIISPSSFLNRLSVRKIPVFLMIGQEDLVVPYRLGHAFANELREAGIDVELLELPCGHYSIAMLPFALITFIRAALFLRPRA